MFIIQTAEKDVQRSLEMNDFSENPAKFQRTLQKYFGSADKQEGL